MVDFPRGPLVVLLPPDSEIVDPTALRRTFPNLSVVQQRSKDVGRCAVLTCPGTVRLISVPVLVDPTADLRTGEKKLHYRRGCSVCDCPLVRSKH